MTIIEYIAVFGFIFTIIELFLVIAAKSGRYVFDIEIYEKNKKDTKNKKELPTYITGIGEINKKDNSKT